MLAGEPARAVAVMLCLAAVLGVLVPAFAVPSFKHDLVEGFLWGRSFQLGYHKHPPLQAWLLGALERLVTDDWRFLAFVLAQGCVAVAILAVWRLGSAIAGPTIGAVSAILTLAGVHFYTSPTQTFTPDTLTLPLWALGLLFYWRAVGEERSRYWYALAVVAAGFVYAKYVGALLFLVLGVLTLATAEGRRALARKEPWLALGLVAVLASPHLWWLATTSANPLAYPLTDPDRLPARSGLERVLFAARFLGSAVLNHTGLALLFVILVWRLPPSSPGTIAIDRGTVAPFARTFLLAACVAPLALVVAFNLAAGVMFRSGWASPFFAASALLVLLSLRGETRLGRLGAAATVVAASITAQHVVPAIATHLDTRGNQMAFPSRALAQELTARYRSATGQPLAIVAGERWVAGGVAFASLDRPLLLIDGNLSISPWITRDSLARSGALVIWYGDTRAPATAGIFQGRAAEGTVTVPFAGLLRAPTASVHYAIVPPEPGPR